MMWFNRPGPEYLQSIMTYKLNLAKKLQKKIGSINLKT